MKNTRLYEQDFYAWVQEQSALIKTKSFDKLDVVNLFDEVQSMGKHEKRELTSRLTILIMHLLKWKYQPLLQSRSWKLTIREQRLEVKDVLDDNPSLKPMMPDFIANAYQKALLKVADETGLDEEVFPQSCEWSAKKLLDDNFFPNSTAKKSKP